MTVFTIPKRVLHECKTLRCEGDTFVLLHWTSKIYVYLILTLTYSVISFKRYILKKEKKIN